MLLVDAANVVGSRPNGWWRDRPGAARDLVEKIRGATADATLEPPIVVVLEGQARKGAEEGEERGVEVVHAPASGDDTIAALALSSVEAVTLVTADRGLRSRVEGEGVEIVGPKWLLSRLADVRPSS